MAGKIKSPEAEFMKGKVSSSEIEWNHMTEKTANFKICFILNFEKNVYLEAPNILTHTYRWIVQ